MEEERKRVHYIHRISYTFQERLVGAFVLASLIFIFGLIFINSRTAHLFEEPIHYHAFLANAEGISSETLVKISGIEVGRVADMDIAADHRIHLDLIVYERYHDLVRGDSKAAVGKLSVLGRTAIEITAGSPEQPILPGGSVLEVDEPMSMDELLARLTPVVEAVETSVQRIAQLLEVVEPEAIDRGIDDFVATSANLKAITERIAQGEGALGMAVSDQRFRDDLQRAMGAMGDTLEQTVARLEQLQPVLANAEPISDGLRDSSKEMPLLLAEGRELLGKLNLMSDEVTLEMREFPELVQRMKVLMERTDRLLDGLSRTWPFGSAEEQQRRRLLEPRQ